MGIKSQYEVFITEECRVEIKSIYEYIKVKLYAEKSGKKMLRKLEELAANLAFAPKIYAEIKKYNGTKRSYRRCIIDNYVVLYTIDEENKKVYISHMYYGGSDYIDKI